MRSNVCSGAPLTALKPSLHLFVDASRQGWGADLEDQAASGLWSNNELRWHINNLELEALILALSHWQSCLERQVLAISTTSRSSGVFATRGLLTSLLPPTFRFLQFLDGLHMRFIVTTSPVVTTSWQTYSPNLTKWLSRSNYPRVIFMVPHIPAA